MQRTIHDELGLAFRQKRLALFGRISFVFLTSYFVVFNAINALNPRRSWQDWLLDGSNQLHLAAAGVLAALWMACRGQRRSERFLVAVDAGAFWLMGLAFTFSAWVADVRGHRNYGMLLELTNAMLIRSVIVPSSGRLTFWISAALVAPATHAHYLFEVRAGQAQMDALRHAVEAAGFCSLAAILAHLTSTVIYGLRRRVREAQTVGQYTLEQKLGEGAMGVVYRARHAMLRRPTAVKLLPPEKSGQAARSRFEREVQLTSKLNHPNTVTIYDYGRTPDGMFYYAMEYLDGVNLEDLVRRFGPLPAARVVHVLKQICASLDEAHRAGLVHRDIKPANVILCERGGASDVVKVVDFGLVKDLDGDIKVSSEQTTAGTPPYMSPEAIQAPEQVEARSDLYSLGALGYHLLTGCNVFEARNLFELFAHHVATPPVPPSQRVSGPMPADLERLILGCLAKDVAGRPPSARALHDALAACTEPGPWSESEAREWWARHGASRAAARDGAPDTTEVTVVLPLKVDLAERMGPPGA